MKTDLTLEIEQKLFDKYKGKAMGTRYAFEVPFKNGIVDFVTSKQQNKTGQPFITFYEIKVSYSDFKSKNGHNFYGDENYYVIPKKLFDEIMEKDPRGFGDVGIIVYSNGRFYTKRKEIQHFCKKLLSIEERFRLLDELLVRNGVY